MGWIFWLVALSAKDVGSVSLWTGFSTLDFECNSCLRPLVVWMWNRGHWDLRVWYDLTQYIIQGHESILVGETEGVTFKWCVMCVSMWMRCVSEMMFGNEWKRMRGEGGEGRKEERNTNLQVQGHLYQNEPRVIQTSSQTQMNQLQFRWYSTDLFTEVSNTFVIVTAHKQVCANQQSHQVSFQISKLNHKQCNRQAAHLFLQTRIWVGFFGSWPCLQKMLDPSRCEQDSQLWISSVTHV